jgi:hypothetical protein
MSEQKKNKDAGIPSGISKPKLDEENLKMSSFMGDLLNELQMSVPSGWSVQDMFEHHAKEWAKMKKDVQLKVLQDELGDTLKTAVVKYLYLLRLVDFTKAPTPLHSAQSSVSHARNLFFHLNHIILWLNNEAAKAKQNEEEKKKKEDEKKE